MSVDARRVLAAHPALDLHSVFSNAVILRAGARLVTCTASAISAPNGVEMAAADLAHLRVLYESSPASGLTWDDARCVQRTASGDAVLAAMPLRIFDATVPDIGFDAVRVGLPPLLERLVVTHPATGIGDEWPALVADRRLTRAVDSLLKYTLGDPVLYWIGRGPGLTPSGDDIVVGMIAAMASVRAVNAVPLAEMGDELEAAVRGRTTDVSAEYLYYACRSMAIGALCDLLSALGRSDPVGVRLAVDRLRRYGHTSGMDHLLGLIAALRYLDSGRGR